MIVKTYFEKRLVLSVNKIKKRAIFKMQTTHTDKVHNRRIRLAVRTDLREKYLME